MRYSYRILYTCAGILAVGCITAESGCQAVKTCKIKEVDYDGGADAFVPWWQLDGSLSDAGCAVTNECGGCGVLAILPGQPCGNCGGEYECDGPDTVRCADPCMQTIGCADGEREAFVDSTTHPNVAACNGGWTEKGILGSSPTCSRISGDDSNNPEGIGCSAADLCAEGWRVCDSIAEFAASSTVGCAAGDFEADTFYAAAVSGDGNEECSPGGTNDLFGCGSVGLTAAASCAPLDRASGDQCEEIPDEFDCPGSWLFGSSTEAEDVLKNGPGGGGVLCCRIVP